MLRKTFVNAYRLCPKNVRKTCTLNNLKVISKRHLKIPMSHLHANNNTSQ